MSTNRQLIGRRQFLVTSSAALAAAAVVPKLFAGEVVAAKRLAVGFARIDDAASVMAAASIPAADGAFIGRGARVSISGVSGVPADPRNRRVVELLVNYSYLDGADRREAPYRAWACNRQSACQGAPVSFNVPVDEVQKISISVGVEQGDRQPGAPVSRRRIASESAAQDEGLPVALTLLSGEGVKLVRGFYVIVPLFDSDGEPRWSRYHIEQVDGRWTLRDDGQQTAPFEHFVIRIDYAKA